MQKKLEGGGGEEKTRFKNTSSIDTLRQSREQSNESHAKIIMITETRREARIEQIKKKRKKCLRDLRREKLKKQMTGKVIL